MSSDHPPSLPRTVLVAITKHGAAQAATLARQLPQASLCVAAKFAEACAGLPNPLQTYDGAFKDQIGELFAQFDQIVFFVSLGAVVRLIAPHLKKKETDPGVVVVDEAGRWAIPVLSGHLGGANAIAGVLHHALGAGVISHRVAIGRSLATSLHYLVDHGLRGIAL